MDASHTQLYGTRGTDGSSAVVPGRSLPALASPRDLAVHAAGQKQAAGQKRVRQAAARHQSEVGRASLEVARIEGVAKKSAQDTKARIAYARNESNKLTRQAASHNRKANAAEVQTKAARSRYDADQAALAAAQKSSRAAGASVASVGIRRGLEAKVKVSQRVYKTAAANASIHRTAAGEATRKAASFRTAAQRAYVGGARRQNELAQQSAHAAKPVLSSDSAQAFLRVFGKKPTLPSKRPPPSGGAAKPVLSSDAAQAFLRVFGKKPTLPSGGGTPLMSRPPPPKKSNMALWAAAGIATVVGLVAFAG